MREFTEQVMEAVAREPEVELTTYGRNTGRPHRTVIWVWGDGRRVFIRSGRGMSSDWPQNLLARGRGMLHVGGLDVPVVPRHVADLEEARSLQRLAEGKYGVAAQRMVEQRYGLAAQPSLGADAATPAELATFELLPAPQQP
jgi:hypothetical protein